MKILYVASEAAPFVRSGGLGDVAGALPKALAQQKNDVRVIIPFYKEEIRDEFQSTFKYVGATFVDLSWRRQYAGVYETQQDGVKYYFIDNEYYFKRRGLYGHFDDGERFAYFSKAILEILPIIDFYPDILHCNDWQTSLVPVFLDVFFRYADAYKNIKTVLTIHNIEFQGKYDSRLITDILGLPEWARSIVVNNEDVNYMKGGIEAASLVTTVSETYANEILDPFFAFGLEGILRERQYKIYGVTNGIDMKLYNPETDKALFKNYSHETISNKKENKKGLCNMVALPYSEKRPMIAMVTRLTEQKGMDLVGYIADELMKADLQVVVIGTGDWKYENLIKHIESRYPEKFRAILAFSSDLASKIYAASDMFLMPSKFEPCGLSQMIAMRYGSVPIVRETGRLKDTVEAYNPQTKKGKGFTFKTYNAFDMLDAIWRAYGFFIEEGQSNWAQIIKNDMKSDFGWEISAKKYLDIYKK